MPADRIAHFEILDELGSGGMGRVFLARDLRLHRTVALKTLTAGQTVSEEARRRLMTEARAASGLNHPAIVTVYEVGSEGEVDFISMERVEGRTLGEILAEEGPLSPERARRYAVELAEALAVAHRGGVIHRDLKPANVMVTADDHLKVLDFGLAKRLVPTESPADSGELPTVADPVQTAAGAVMGTPAYMAPEQARGGTVGPRTDLFAFGAIVYEMLTGRRAFEGRSPLEVLSAVLCDSPPPPSGIRQELPETWDALVSRLLAKDPDQRPASATAVLEELQRDEPETGARPTRPRPRLGTIAILGLVLGVALGVGWLLRKSPRAVPTASPAAGDDFPDYRFRLLVDLPGSQREPALSPDGKFVVFVQDDAEGIAQIWIADLVGGTPRPLTEGSPGGTQPSWGPDGETIVYANPDGLWEIPAPLGGEARRLFDRGARPSLSPDGRLLAFVADRRPWVAAADGTDPRPLEPFESTFFGYLAAPAFSPDGDHLVTFWPEENRPLGDLWIVPVDDPGDAARLTDLSFMPRETSPSWTADGRWILFSSDHGGAVNIWRVAASGGEPLPVTRGAGSDYSPDVTDDLSRLVYANGRSWGQIRILDPATGRERTAIERRDLLVVPDVSPDGRRAAFFARTPSSFHLFVADLEAEEIRQVTRGETQLNLHPAWSSDGRWLYFYQQEPTLSFRRVPADGGPDELVLDDWSWPHQNRTRPSPSGDRVAYTVRDSGRLMETRVRDLATGAETVLPVALYAPFWSGDGQSILGTSWNPAAALRCPTDGGECRTLAEDVWDLRRGPQGGIYGLSGSSPTIVALDPASGETTPLHTVENYDSTNFGWGIGSEGEIVHQAQVSEDLELWIGEADTP